MRAYGWPVLSAVARVMASGSTAPLARSSACQARNWAIGSRRIADSESGIPNCNGYTIFMRIAVLCAFLLSVAVPARSRAADESPRIELQTPPVALGAGLDAQLIYDV